MKKFISLGFILLYLVFWGCKQNASEIKVIGFNIRYDNPDDGINAWPNRIPLVKAYLSKESPDIIGFQEALHHQVKDLEGLLPEYRWVGTGRTNGKQEGEYVPVFFKRSVFEMEDEGQFWLSDTPEVPGSIGPGAVLPRIATWVKLTHKASQIPVFVFNTHYSHVSDEARRQAAEIMAERMKRIAGTAPLILIGDFNIEFQSETYQQVSNLFHSNNYLMNTVAHMDPEKKPAKKTYQGFSEATRGSFIDFIFVNEHFSVKDFRIDKVKTDSVYISDHWPVKTLLKIQ
ncbi:MAG: endonuclease/exonuclease/phosphatase family protein [Bacteroidales bacterium]|jgi:endonuclease/exonuclease/phosphatase family metal-dependent hydrolase|nr:endonuclease/exonuclease/phosphatase family protein [Bacteroidales bacterium]NLM91756.1 endonuclease/exonuclease/phosphatase family protein [Bacteroidales bacterium]